MILAHVGHDHGAHHWAPFVILAACALLAFVLLARRKVRA
jgi:hypothetical protein